MKKILLTIILSLAVCGTWAQVIRIGTSAPASAALDTPKRFEFPRTTIKPYAKVINKLFTTKRGLFTVHQHKDTIYFEIPDSILHRDIEVINRLEKGPGGLGVYAGEYLDEKTISFEKNLSDSTIRIRYDLVISHADSTNRIFRAVANSNEAPVVASFPIKAYGKDRHSYVIDIGSYLKLPTSLFNESGSKLGPVMDIKLVKDIVVQSTAAYPINVEISVIKNVPGKAGVSNNPNTLVTRTSFVELPLVPLQQRIADPRVGFFADEVYNFADDQQKVEDRKFILRWRLEPRPADLDKWKKGELVEPAKPIVIYIDPATPKQWRPFLIQGINDWQKAFEQAGFKNAIMGKEWPEGDTTMHMDDARFSFINYLPSNIANAYGPQVHDPRSGEIIQTQIGWYHNVMQLVHDWYMIQAGAVDPKARHPKFDDDLMGQLVRFVSSHEVGHTLGLRHNMGSSSRTPVDSLRNEHYLAIHGHTASIMDYARFNYVAQPEDHIPENGLFPHIGEYDTWAIEWGYKNNFAATPDADNKINYKLTTDRLAKNPRLWFGIDNRESTRNDPRCLSEDLGDNAMKASSYGIKNLKRILPNLPAWTHEEGGSYENLSSAYSALKDQFTRYMQHVMSNVGGLYTTPRSETDGKPVYEPTPKALQQEAITFYNRELFTTPYWILNPAITSKASEAVHPDFVEDLQVKVLNKLMDINKINLLLGNQRAFNNEAYPLDEYITALHHSIWSELPTGKAIDPYRRNLQKSYVANLQQILLSSTPGNIETDAFSVLRADILRLQKEVNYALPKVTDRMTRYHLQDIQVRVRKTLEANPVIQ